MTRDELKQAVRYSEDVRAFGTPEELEIVGANESAFAQLMTVLDEVESAPNPLPDEMRRRLLQACEVVDALFPLTSPGPTSVSVIVACARRCISEGIT